MLNITKKQNFIGITIKQQLYFDVTIKSKNHTMSLAKKYVKSKKAYKVNFSLPKTVQGKDIRVLGEFNNWDWDSAPSMKKSKDGYKVEILLAPGKVYEFRYCIDKDTWVNDASADSYKHVSCFCIDNCVVDLLNIDEEVPAKKVVAKKAPVKKVVAKKPVAKKAPAKKAPVKKMPAKKVNLTAIEGVGPKIAGLLAEAGLATFEAVAKAKPAAIKKVLLAAGKRYTMHDPATWPKQAKLLASGKLELLKKLQDELKGGRKAK